MSGVVKILTVLGEQLDLINALVVCLVHLRDHWKYEQGAALSSRGHSSLRIRRRVQQLFLEN